MAAAPFGESRPPLWIQKNLRPIVKHGGGSSWNEIEFAVEEYLGNCVWQHFCRNRRREVTVMGSAESLSNFPGKEKASGFNITSE
ncbi:hypothetical protein TNCV_3094121 [Trichonephila clavipes]|nr:hypothetical protein TNCV_3094121 [Trichonephila clavipes]